MSEYEKRMMVEALSSMVDAMETIERLIEMETVTFRVDECKMSNEIWDDMEKVRKKMLEALLKNG